MGEGYGPRRTSVPSAQIVSDLKEGDERGAVEFSLMDWRLIDVRF